jgi:hypothetical protein
VFARITKESPSQHQLQATQFLKELLFLHLRASVHAFHMNWRAIMI